MSKEPSYLTNILFCCIASIAVGFIPAIGLAENWLLLRSGTENYYYDKDSVVEVEKGIKEVYDASRSVKSTTKRQIRIDCGRRKFALGETVGWVGEREVSHFYWNKNGWVWVDITKDNFNPKLFKAVCRAK
jgi:hypothetical protein